MKKNILILKIFLIILMSTLYIVFSTPVAELEIATAVWIKWSAVIIVMFLAVQLTVISIEYLSDVYGYVWKIMKNKQILNLAGDDETTPQEWLDEYKDAGFEDETFAEFVVRMLIHSEEANK